MVLWNPHTPKLHSLLWERSMDFFWNCTIHFIPMYFFESTGSLILLQQNGIWAIWIQRTGDWFKGSCVTCCKTGKGVSLNNYHTVTLLCSWARRNITDNLRVIDLISDDTLYYRLTAVGSYRRDQAWLIISQYGHPKKASLWTATTPELHNHCTYSIF